MLPSNTMRYCSSTFIITQPTPKSALLVSRVALDTTNCKRVNSISISGNQPNLTDRKFIFKIDNAYYTISGGQLVPYTGAVNVDGILENGNDASYLTSLNNIECLLNKQIYPVIAISAAYGLPIRPTVKFALNVLQYV